MGANGFVTPAIGDAVAQVLKEHPELGYIRVEGHADATGLPAWNKVLSRWRAQMVRNELIARGVPADRLGIIGFGDKSPIADNDSETGRNIFSDEAGDPTAFTKGG